MAPHHFISYSPPDAQDFALRLADALVSGPPSLPVWLDKRRLRPGRDWDDQIAEALRGGRKLMSCALLKFGRSTFIQSMEY